MTGRRSPSWRIARLRTHRFARRRFTLRAYAAGRRFAERLGVQVLANSFYSPIPHSRELAGELWRTPSTLPGIRLDLAAQLEFIADGLSSYLDEFQPPATSTGKPGEYHSVNGSYGRGDADVLYAMVRHRKPRRIVELGSGHSTLVMASAILRNHAEGHACSLVSFDPFPSVAFSGLEGLADLRKARAQDVDPAAFATLGPSDILFVDTTHVVKIGGDVNFVLLEVLPRLPVGVAVHLHDIFLPWEYPKHWVRKRGLFWSEQYLLQAFLSLNRDYAIVCALHALAREFPARLAELLPNWNGRPRPGAFWIERVGA